MRNTVWITASIFVIVLATRAGAPYINGHVRGAFYSTAHAQDVEWQKVDEIFGRKPAFGDDVHPTALHSHTLDENPRLFFMHFWANDDAIKLAKGLRAALDKTTSTKS